MDVGAFIGCKIPDKSALVLQNSKRVLQCFLDVKHFNTMDFNLKIKSRSCFKKKEGEA